MANAIDFSYHWNNKLACEFITVQQQKYSNQENI